MAIALIDGQLDDLVALPSLRRKCEILLLFLLFGILGFTRESIDARGSQNSDVHCYSSDFVL